MGLEALLITLTFALVAIVVLALTIVAWRRGRSPGSLTFALMMVVVAVWLAASAFEGSTQNVTAVLLATKIAYLGISWAGTLWFVFALDFAFPEYHYGRRLARWLSIIPLVNIGLVMTNELHGFVWTQITPYITVNEVRLVFERGWWFWVFVVYTYLQLAAGLTVLVMGMLRFPPTRRMQALGMTFGLLLPWIANILYITGHSPSPGLDITPFGFTLTGVLYVWALFYQKLFEQDIQAHEFILENIGDGYLIVDQRGRIAEINRLACHFLSLYQPDAVGQRVDSVLEYWPALLELLHSPEKTMAEVTTGGEQPQFLEASRYEWLKGGQKKAGHILILRDITRRKKAEESLRDSERLYHLLVDAMPVGIALTDDVGRLTFVSPSLHRIYQQQDDAEIIGQSVLRWVHPDDRSIAMMRMIKVIEDHDSLPPQEYRLMRRDGSIFWGEITSTPITDHQGEPRGMLAIIRDVAQRRELESRLENHLEQQTFINNLLQTLYRPHDVFAALSQVLEQTGLYTQANRVYLCKDSGDGMETSIVLEWCSTGISSRARESAFFRYATVPTWRECMEERGMLLAPEGASASPDIAEYMGAWNVLSLAAFPVYGSEERLYGFLGFDHCEEARKWSDEDLDVLWSVCRIVSGAVAQRQVEEAEYRQRILAEVLHDTASTLNSTLNFEEVLDRILINLEQIVEHDAASIALVDEEGMVRFVRWRGYDPSGDEIMKTLHIPVTERGTYRFMAETGEPIIIPDTLTDQRWKKDSAYDWIRSYAGMPITIKGKTAGFINIDSGKEGCFTPDLSYSLHVFADQAAVAIENARLYDATHHRAEEMSMLNRIGLTMTAGLEMDQILASLFEQCQQALPIDVFYVALYDAETGLIELPLYYEEGRFSDRKPQNIQENPGVTGEVIRQRRTIFLPDTSLPEIEQQYHINRIGGPPSRSYVGVPLILHNQVVGIISMQNYQPYAYSSDQIRLLETIAIQAAIAVQNARLYEQMKQMAITDAVTMLNTRRHITALGRSEVERALRYNRKVGVLMVDIDHFKKVNDTFGHTAGDQVLLGVANTCRQALRTTDLVGRWGGEEYVIILPEADKDGAALIAERIRRMVAETDMVVGKDRTRVTVSIGVAVLNEKARTLEVLIDCADRAMYAAKQAGRNRVMADGG